MSPKKQNTNGELQFTVVARDSQCEETIRRQADSRRIDVYTRGHARNRLYFSCSRERWDRFYDKIKDLCLIEPPVPCPSRVSKTIRRNLQKTAANGRLNPVRTNKASEILAAINAKPDAETTQAQDKPTPVETSVDSYKLGTKFAKTVARRIRNLAGTVVTKSFKHMLSFVMGKRSLARAHKV